MIGDNLKKILAEKGISAKWLAEEVGVSPTHLSYVVNNKRNLSFELAEKIADVLHISLTDLVQKEGLPDKQDVPSDKSENIELDVVPVLDDPKVRALARRSLSKDPSKEALLKKLITSMLEDDD